MASTHMQKNYGFGKQLLYAAHQAIVYLYRGGHYSASKTHNRRFSRFIRFLMSEFNIRDARNIKQEHLDAYAKHVAAQFSAGELSLKYVRNLISSMNVGMSAFRNDDLMFAKPSDYLPNGSNIRTEPPACSDENVMQCLHSLQQQKKFREFAVVWLVYHFSMRVREAVLADLYRLKVEAKRTGQVCILEGTKGGRKSKDRIIEVGDEELAFLEFLYSVCPSGSDNLLSEDETFIQFQNKVLNPLRKVLKKFNIPNFREIRALGLNRVYESRTGYLSPVRLNALGIYDDQDASLVLEGLKEVSRTAGHGRIEVAYAYVGKPKK